MQKGALWSQGIASGDVSRGGGDETYQWWALSVATRSCSLCSDEANCSQNVEMRHLLPCWWCWWWRRGRGGVPWYVVRRSS